MSKRTVRAKGCVPPREYSVPAWVGDLACEHPLIDEKGDAGIIRVPLDNLRFQHVSVQLEGAREMNLLTFEQRVASAYRSVFEILKSRSATYPIRFWNFVPGIHDDLGEGMDRYMAFNAGRFSAYLGHFGPPAVFARSVPTASAVGIPGDDFILHCLACSEPGFPLENPRQVSSYHYSQRFGPTPPCFARATLLRGRGGTVLLAGGTASITGEDSRHLGFVNEQARETIRNLASLVANAAGERLPDDTSELDFFLARFRELRVYYSRGADERTIAAFIRSNIPQYCRVEMLPASLCRRELLVEIEGLALL